MSFEPVWDEKSHILILGTYPSPKSREMNFYYGHPQNRFWKLLARLLECPVPASIPEKKQMLLSHNIAVWDVCDRCRIDGAADSSIKEVVPHDITALLTESGITQVFCNGAKAYELYRKHIGISDGITVTQLPSTSPANAAWSIERLAGEWAVILRHL